MIFDRINYYLRRVYVFPIVVYQKLISSGTGASCRYYPSCSEYFKQAVLKHGLVKGNFLGVARILRCSPFFTGGYDPVRPYKTWKLLLAKIKKDYRRYKG